MKKIKVAFLDGNLNDVFGYTYFFLKKLEKYYVVEISDAPDYVFFRESTYTHFLYDSAIKIFYTGENISPDFNTCDYAISFDYIDFQDRHYRFPLYLAASFYSKEELELAGENYLTKKSSFTKDDLSKKTEFCSFVYSNYRGNEARKTFFTLLSAYKKVNAGGSYLNTIGGEKIKNKLSYEEKHKFSIAFENSSRSGYTTEKLVSALVAKTIPIYWGDPDAGKEFNAKRFINCHDYRSFDDVVKKVKELNENDDLYLKMMNEKILVEHYDPEKIKKGLDNFLKQIVDQDITTAKRRTINEVKAFELKKQGLLIMRQEILKQKTRKLFQIFYKPFKKNKTIEKIKEDYYRRKKL